MLAVDEEAGAHRGLHLGNHPTATDVPRRTVMSASRLKGSTLK